MMPTKLRLKLANECADILARTKLNTIKKDFKYSFLHSRDLNDQILNKMMNLFEPLMRDMYEKSSWGWKKEVKLSEWRHPRTRVVLVTQKDICDLDKNIVANGIDQLDEENELVGFICFRFESGADKNECALYVYELHIREEFQRQGLGEELMRMVRQIAIEFKMDKIMLTVFRTNEKALKFYNKLNFVTDESSPSKKEADYMILSSRIK